jgi:DNA-binding response OmpR family regulator
MNNLRILIAEDDANIREGLVDLFTAEGAQVYAAPDGDAALRRWRDGGVDLVILDLMMPRRSGYDVCRDIRRTDANVPIIMLTAKGEEIDKVVGLELGADDYVTKPFGVRELLARVNAILRRSRRCGPAAAGENAVDLPEAFRFGDAEIHRGQLRGTLAGRAFDLTPRELHLLEYLAERPGLALARSLLIRAIWGHEYFGTTRTLDQHVAQLRKKIEPDPANPRFLTTVHGVGYRYEPLAGNGDKEL